MQQLICMQKEKTKPIRDCKPEICNFCAHKMAQTLENLDERRGEKRAKTTALAASRLQQLSAPLEEEQTKKNAAL